MALRGQRSEGGERLEHVGVEDAFGEFGHGGGGGEGFELVEILAALGENRLGMGVGVQSVLIGANLRIIFCTSGACPEGRRWLKADGANSNAVGGFGVDAAGNDAVG